MRNEKILTPRAILFQATATTIGYICISNWFYYASISMVVSYMVVAPGKKMKQRVQHTCIKMQSNDTVKLLVTASLNTCNE